MEKLVLSNTDLTPAVLLDSEKGVFQIEGRSLTEEAATFYKPVHLWMDAYAKAPNPKTEFIFKLEYFNTPASHQFLDLFKILQKVPNGSVTWYFLEDDEDMEEAGQELAELVSIPFELKPY